MMHRPKEFNSSEHYLLRSMFFVPGHVEKYLIKASQLNADALILDVEDAVPLHQKDDARMYIKKALHEGLFKGKQIIIRINELDEGMLLKDLDAVLHKDVLGIMPAKTYSKQDMAFFDEVLKQYEYKLGLEVGHFKLLPLIETLLSFENINDIANSTDRLIALAFGGEDYLKELGGKHGENDHTFDYPRTKIAIAAKAAGLQAIDTPYLDVHDIDGFEMREQKSKDLGFEGCLLIHPKQIELANNCFSPSDEEFAKASKIFESVKYAEEKGLSVALMDGVLIGPPMKKNAFKTLSKQSLINRK
ncbi:CoA ester lyase [bacterium]|nr:MAG: CoA ester lyase [bacterium]